jgi:hypothetical protein
MLVKGSAASAAATRTIVCMKASSVGDAVTVETRPVGQTIYSPGQNVVERDPEKLCNAALKMLEKW